MSYLDSLLPVDKARYLEKLNSIGIDICPYVIKDWTDDPTQWPPVAFQDIYSYPVANIRLPLPAHNLEVCRKCYIC